MSELTDESSARGRTGRAALNAFAVRIMSAGIAYFSQVLLARWMGSADYGVFVWVWIWVLILGGLSSLGMNITLIRFVPEYEEQGRHDLLRGVLVGSRIVTFLISAGVAGLGILGLMVAGDYVSSQYVLPLYLALFCLPAYTLTDLHDGVGRAKSWINLALVPPYVLRPLLILIGMVLARALGLPMTATTAAGCAIAATWSASILQLVLIERRLGRSIPGGARVYDARTWVRTSAPIWFITACELLIQNTDVLVLSRYISPSEVGIYFAALKTISLIAFVHYAVGSAIAGRLSTLNARGDREQLAATIRDGANWTFWPSLIGAIVLLILGKPLLSLFGPEFTAGYPAMFVLVIGLLFRASVGPAEYVLRMLGQQTACAMILGGTAALNIMLNLALVPQFGMMGAASATSISLVVATCAFLAIAQRRLGLSIAVWGVVRPA